MRVWRAMAETTAALELTHRRPAFGIESVAIDGEVIPVREEVADAHAVRHARALRQGRRPARSRRVLIVPGLAGHFATFVRGTVKTLLPDHDVYVADWHNARDVPVTPGRFGLDEYVEHLIDFLAAIGPGAHLMAVCQPCVAGARGRGDHGEDEHPAQPRSITLIAGPVDARINPGPVNHFASASSLESLERTRDHQVPWPHQGARPAGLSRVPPGRGLHGHGPRAATSRPSRGLFGDSRGATTRGAERTRRSTRSTSPSSTSPPSSTSTPPAWSSRTTTSPAARCAGAVARSTRRAIETALITIEAENDEICPPGQTEAAHALCTGIPAERRRHISRPASATTACSAAPASRPRSTRDPGLHRGERGRRDRRGRSAGPQAGATIASSSSRFGSSSSRLTRSTTVATWSALSSPAV